MPLKPPVAEKRPVTTLRHGVADVDDYAWLRAPNWQETMRDPSKLPAKIRRYLEAWNDYTKEEMAPTGSLQDVLYREMKGRIKEDDSSVPSPDGPYDYYVRYRTGGQHGLIVRRPRGDADPAREELLFDGDKEAEGTAYFSMGDVAHSHDHTLLATSTDTVGAELYTIRVRTIADGRIHDDVIEDTAGDIVWAPSGKGFYYSKLDDAHRPREIYFHALGTDQAADRLIYREPDEGFFVSISLSEGDAWLFIAAHDHQTSEIWLLPADEPGDPKLMEPRREEIEYDASQFFETFLILTNDGAEDYRLMAAPAAAPGRANWNELIPHRPGCLLLGIDVTARHLVRLETRDALPRLIVQTIAQGRPGQITLGPETVIRFEEEAYSLGISGGYEFDTDTLRLRYSSPTTPAQVIDYDMGTGARTLRKTQEVPSGHDSADYVTRRIFATAPDGETVPITVLHRADTAVDATAPCLLYGYGSYGMSMPASFGTVRLSLVDRGFVYAIAHVRGGMEKGYRWYRMGKREAKLNTFTDFIACAGALEAAGYAAPGRIIAQGGSAGGLLVGAVANMRPGLFLGIIADVPFVDVLNTMWDAGLPLTPPEWAEWGNPIEDPDAAALIRSYAPYENVQATDYPHMLVTAGVSDPNVTYWEPAKWVARLAERRTGGRLLLFKTNMDAGHQGASGRFDQLKEDAFAYAFALRIAMAAER